MTCRAAVTLKAWPSSRLQAERSRSGCDATEVGDPDFTATRRASIDQIVDYFKEAWKYLPLDGDEFPMESVIGIFAAGADLMLIPTISLSEKQRMPGFYQCRRN